MKKVLLPLDEFIKEHLLQNYADMVDHLHKSQFLPEIAQYIENEQEYSPSLIITLRIKLLEYYSCLRCFEVCHFIQADIKRLLNSKFTFENTEIEAQYYMLQGIQHRNFSGAIDFKLSEEYFLQSEQPFLNLLKNKDNSKTQQQAFTDEYFRSLMNRLGLYVNYNNQSEKAHKLIEHIELVLQTTKISVVGYLSIYHYCVGSYYLNHQNYDKSVNAFDLAKKEIESAVGAFWSMDNRFKELINERFKEAKEKSGQSSMGLYTNQTVPSDQNLFFQLKQQVSSEQNDFSMSSKN